MVNSVFCDSVTRCPLYCIPSDGNGICITFIDTITKALKGLVVETAIAENR